MQPLDGYRVIDLSTYYSGPFAALHLVDLGADVVKVESPAGDPQRKFGVMRSGVSVGFANINRGKRSVALDLTTDAGREDLFGLIRSADALIGNWRPGVADRLGLSDGAIELANPRLVHLWITGFGVDGPLAAAPTYDPITQAYSGLAWSEGSNEPRLLNSFIADKMAGVYAAQSILAALLVRERTGRGGRVDVSLLDSLAYFNFPDMFASRTIIGDAGEQKMRPLPTLVKARDGYLVICPGQGRDIRNTCIAAGHPEWVESLQSFRDYRDIGPRLIELLETVTGEQDVKFWVERMRELDVPVSEVMDLDNHLADPQVVVCETYGEMSDPRLGAIRYARYPGRWRSAERISPSPYPEIDEHGGELRVSEASSDRKG